MSHRPYCKKIPMMALVHSRPDFKQFSGNHTCGRNNNIIVIQNRDHLPDSRFPVYVQPGSFIFPELVLFESTFSDHKGKRLSGSFLICQSRLQLSFKRFILSGQYLITDPHCFQQRQCHLTLLNVLRFIFNPRLSPPSDNQ